jgi:hypothetical protein
MMYIEGELAITTELIVIAAVIPEAVARKAMVGAKFKRANKIN